MTKQEIKNAIYNGYQLLAVSVSVPEITSQTAAAAMNSLSQKVPSANNNFRSKTAVRQKFLLDCKQLYLQYLPVKRSYPDQISPKMGSLMDQLLHALSKYEATEVLNSNVLNGLPSGFDPGEIFSRKAVYLKLPTQTALEILRDIEKAGGESAPADEPTPDPISVSGSTPYSVHEAAAQTPEAPEIPSTELPAAQEDLVPAAASTDAELSKLAEELIRSERNSACVTAFVDESLRPVLWNRYGYSGPVGAYSYILCRGDLRSEREIRKERILATGVDFCEETEHIEKIAETAIGKVLISLLYNHNFTGSVHIYTDNRNAAQNWHQNPAATRLASQFASVSVQYIPREHNTIADRLCRSRMLLNMPAEAYQEILTKITRYDEIIKIVSPESSPS